MERRTVWYGSPCVGLVLAFIVSCSGTDRTHEAAGGSAGASGDMGASGNTGTSGSAGAGGQAGNGNGGGNAGASGDAASGASSGGASGASGAAGSGAGSGAGSICAMAPPSPAASATLIDNLDDGNLIAETHGDWYSFQDSTSSVDPMTFGVSTGAHSGGYSIHAHPGQYTNWGSGLGLLLDKTGSAAKLPLDVSAYDGIQFWARSSSPGWVRVNFPDANSDPAGGRCSSVSGTCYQHFGADRAIDSSWRLYRIQFDELYQTTPDGTPGLDSNALYQIEFTFGPYTAYDIWVDDLSFFNYAPTAYNVSGRHFRKNHQERVFRGVARPSLEWDPAGVAISLADFQHMRAWGADTVRIALNQGFWLPSSAVYAPSYRSTVDQAIACAQGAGLDVILDLHWSDRGNSLEVPAQQKMADTNSVAFWQDVATRYKNNSRILFELYNEPHDVSWSVWRDGGSAGSFSAVGFQQLYDAVRGTGAENVVLVGGLNWAYDLTGVYDYEIRGFNVGYAVHPYNFAGKQAADWQEYFGWLVPTRPVIATEFGDTTSCSAGYSQSFMNYADSLGMSWTAWAWWVDADANPCDFPALLSDWNGTPNTAGSAVRAELSP